MPKKMNRVVFKEIEPGTATEVSGGSVSGEHYRFADEEEAQRALQSIEANFLNRYIGRTAMDFARGLGVDDEVVFCGDRISQIDVYVQSNGMFQPYATSVIDVFDGDGNVMLFEDGNMMVRQH